MSKFLSYLRNDKGGAVEYVLVMAAVGALVVGVGNSNTAKTAMNSLVESVLNNAKNKGTM